MEVGLAFVRDDQVSGVWECLVNPGRGIPEQVSRLHGITDDHVAGAPSLASIRDELFHLTDGAPIFLAHGADFETRFLEAAGLGALLDVSRGTMVDTLRMAREFFPRRSNRLGDLLVRLGVEQGTAHRAGPDAAACARAWCAMRRLQDLPAQSGPGRSLESLRAKATGASIGREN